jgi:hypothetical protein
VQILKTQGGPDTPAGGPFRAVFEDPPPCTGGDRCTVTDCCVPMTCANNDGIANTLAGDGYQEWSCGKDRVLKSKTTHPPSGTNCTGDRCLASDCCDGLYCTNNIGTPNHYIRAEANGWGWRDVCPFGQEPLSPTPMAVKDCT